MTGLGKLLIFGGLLLVALGIVFIFFPKFPLGRLPGDIRIERENFSFYFPLATCIVISLLLTLIFWILRR